MTKYIEPMLDILYFDEEEITAALSNTPQPTDEPQTARYSADLMNEYFLYERDAKQTSTVRLRDVGVTGE